MNKKALLACFIIVILLVGGVFYLQMGQKESDNQAAQTTQTETIEQPVADQPAVTGNPGQYIDYSAEAVRTTPGTKVLFFHASWCPQCRQLEKEIKAGPLPNDTTIFKVDYDTNQALRQQYGVTLQTTLVKVDDNGNMVEKFVAYDEPTLAEIKENIL